MIPRIIHQTWKTNIIPENWKDAVASCKKVNSDFEYMLWTDETMDDFVKKNYPDFYSVYRSYAHDIQRCDAFRYLVLYKYGGCYLDMDIVCKHNLSSYLKYDIIFTKSINISTFTNSFYMTTPNHPFFKFCIEQLPAYVNSHKFLGKHIHVMTSTGPYFLTNMLQKYKLETIPNHYILTKEEFAGDCNVCNENICKGGKLFSHIKGQSWNSYDSLFYNYCLCNYKKIIATLIAASIFTYILLNINKKKGSKIRQLGRLFK
jgi:mannosyltransferase OCH1-like enzyme